MLSRRSLRTLTPAVLVTAARCLSAPTAFARTSAAATAAAASAVRAAIPPETLAAIDGLEPPSLWSHFAAVSSIPRPSRAEAAVLGYVKDFADERGLRWTEDGTGNLCVFRPGSGGGEGAPPVIVQGHVDMVTEKNSDSNHDFHADPVRLRRFERGGSTWVGARGTTLGADNGIGIAAALALLGAPADGAGRKALPPLEALFTVDEETGLTGAMALDAEALGLTGRTMLNLDTEEWGDLYVGCAGGGETRITLPLRRVAAAETCGDEYELLELRIDGLVGGHSGINIHEGRANAILLCAAAARAALSAAGPEGGAALVSICGGDKHNAIPREASAVLAVARSARPAVEAAVAASREAAKAEYGTLEKGLRVVLTERSGAVADEEDTPPLDSSSSDRLLAMLVALPVGPLKYSHVIPDLVETSNNVASVTLDESEAAVLCSSRSSIGTALESTRNRIQAVASLAGAEVERSDAYPGWAPNPDSAVLDVARGLLVERLGREPGVKAIHAGLECGLLLEKLGGDPGVDIISFGPTIEGAHSPDECLDVETVQPFFELVEDILAELAKRRA